MRHFLIASAIALTIAGPALAATPAPKDAAPTAAEVHALQSQVARLSAIVSVLQRERDDAVEARDALARSLATISPDARNSITVDEARRLEGAIAAQPPHQ